MSVSFPMDLPNFLSRGPLGEIRFAGHRIDFYIVLYDLNEGYSEQRLACQFPTLDPKLIRQAVDFHQNHREKLSTYLADVLAAIEAQRTKGDHAPSLAELIRRLEDRRRRRSVLA